MKCRIFLLLALLAVCRLNAQTTLHVGPGQTYASLSAAVGAVQPGDTIEIHAGTYPGGLFFSNLKGTPSAWITLRAAAGETVIFQGGNNSIQLSDPAYLHIERLIFQQQLGNGFNLDDGGTYATPAHHIVFEECTFRDIAATGNNDLLKLSGLDTFVISRCTIQNGSPGGSGIDMVGCHWGVFENNVFENLGSNSIQAKGGTQHIRIEGNFFRNGGQRTLNLGGSTGLQFFRPDTAHFEAADLQVYANVIVGSWAAVAYVGSVNVEVVNNTIYMPENWVARILQETVDTSRFYPCGNNSFINNLVVPGPNLNTAVNVGPNTAPQTFTFSHNLWYKPANPNWTPVTPVPDPAAILHTDPLLADPANFDFHLQPGSPAIGAGLAVPAPVYDYYDSTYNVPRSIGAVEGEPMTTAAHAAPAGKLTVYPNPMTETAVVSALPLSAAMTQTGTLAWYNADGRLVRRQPWTPGQPATVVARQGLAAGGYTLVLYDAGRAVATARVMVL